MENEWISHDSLESLVDEDVILDEKVILSHGFNIVTSTGKKIYRIKPADYPFNIQLVINPQYERGNPNVGIISIYSPSMEINGVPPDLYKAENWTEKDHERARNYMIPFVENVQPIAWHVYSLDRLKGIYYHLTRERLVKGK